MNRKNGIVVFHIIGWLIFLTLPLVIMPKPALLPEPNAERYIFTGLIINNLVLIGFFYLNYHVLTVRYLLAKKYIQYILLIIFFGFFFIVPFFKFQGVDAPPPPVHVFPADQEFIFATVLIQKTFMFLLILFLSIGSKFYFKWIKSEEARKTAENSRLTLELSYLKAQINPHFLFNTLNTLYTLSLTKSDRAADAILKLSELMRYSIHEAQADEVELEKETEILLHYIELQKLRLSGEHTKVKIEIDGSGAGGLKIAPMLLIPFVENAFKYGISNEMPSMISIAVKVNTAKGSVDFSAQNTIVKKHSEPGAKSGIGIKNTLQRLESFYPGRFSCQITDTGTLYTVHLKISLK